MKKPKKKDIPKDPLGYTPHSNYGYNQACDDWEAYFEWWKGQLSKEKIINMAWDCVAESTKSCMDCCTTKAHFIPLAKAISKRIRSEG